MTRKDVSQGTLAYGGDQTDSSVQPNFTSPMEIPQIAKSDKTNLWSSFKEYPKADTIGNNCRAVLLVAGKMKTFVNDSETKEESPSMIEIFSGTEVEPSLKGSPRTSDGNNKSVALNDIPAEILVFDRSVVCSSGVTFDKSEMHFM